MIITRDTLADALALMGFVPAGTRFVRTFGAAPIEVDMRAGSIRYPEAQRQNTCIVSAEFSPRVVGDIAAYFVHHQVRNVYAGSISSHHLAEARTVIAAAPTRKQAILDSHL